MKHFCEKIKSLYVNWISRTRPPPFPNMPINVLLFRTNLNFQSNSQIKAFFHCMSLFYFTEIIGDGNCFYRSIAQYRYENQEEHVGVRKRIIAYMSGTDCPKEEGEQRRRRYQAMVAGSYDEYLRFVHILILKISMSNINTVSPTFLAHLSWKLKWAFLITCRPSSVRPSSVRPSVCL